MDQTHGAQEEGSAGRPSLPRYQIRIQGQLDNTWSDWFDGLEVMPEENGETVIAGPIPDQTALHGILTKLRDLRLPILSVTRVHPET